MTIENPATEDLAPYYLIEDVEEFTEWIELESMQARLPIGINHHARFVTNTEYKTDVFTGNSEIELGELEDRYGKGNLLRILQYFIPQIVDTIDNIKFNQIADNVASFIGDMYVSDVIAIVVSVRIEGQHWGIPISCTCPCYRAIEIKPKVEEDYHDLRGLKFNVWRGEREPLFRYQLLKPIGDRDCVILAPPKFSHVFDPGYRESKLAEDSKLVILLGDIDEDTYEKLRGVDRNNLKQWAEKINTIGMELSIEMFCPECDEQWESPLVLGINHPDFALSLLQAPKAEEGTTRDYLFELIKFLTFGEQAPFKSASEILNLTPKTRSSMIEALSESYKEQARKMKSK